MRERDTQRETDRQTIGSYRSGLAGPLDPYLCRGGGLAGTDGPHRLIGEHNLAPVLDII